MRAKNLLPGLLLIVFGCTIIEDSDISTRTDLDELALTSFSLNEATDGNADKSVKATLLADSVKNIPLPDGTSIGRVVWYSLPTWTSTVIKFRSGTQSALKIYNSFLSDDKPYTFVLYQGDSAVEIYQFRYLNGKLNKIITTIDPVDNLPFTVRTNDSLVYSGADITSIIRRSPDPAQKGTFSNITYQISGGGFQSSRIVSSAEFGSTMLYFGHDNCPNNAGTNCLTANASYNSNTGGTNASYTIKSKTVANADLMLAIEKSNSNNCCRALDTIYFHPLMYWRSQVQNGSSLLPLYIIDWLVLGAPEANAGFQPINIDIRFSYER